jgi:autotransporter-associated beta strand protein
MFRLRQVAGTVSADLMRHQDARVNLLAALLLAGSCSSVGAQTWRTAAGLTWSQPENWGGTLPTDDGTADLLFSLPSNPNLSQGLSRLDRDWNIRSITWNPTALSNGKVVLDSPRINSVLTLQSGLSNVSVGASKSTTPVSPWALSRRGMTPPRQRRLSNSPGVFVYGAVTGSGGIRKTGSGTIRLSSQASSYSGGNVLTEGVLEVPNHTALGSHAAVQFEGEPCASPLTR